MAWITLAQQMDILTVHVALLRTGHILGFGGDQHDKGLHDANQINATRLFDCATFQVTPIASPTSDVFCAGHAFLEDGRLLVTGGTEAFPFEVPGIHHPSFPGLRDTWIYDPASIADVTKPAWTKVASMNPQPGFEAQNSGGGRWYPSCATLPDGKILALSGHPGSTDTRPMCNDRGEIYSLLPKAKGGKWKLVRAKAGDHIRETTDYPRIHLLPSGEVFCATGMPPATHPHPHPPACFALKPSTGKWREVCDAPTDAAYDMYETTSVLLPLLPSEQYRARVLRCGAQQPIICDLGAAIPSWQPTAPRALAGAPVRRHACAVILPTGDVFYTGGTPDGLDASGVLTPELYSSATGTWSTLEPASVPRNYHSVAILMPDGRVWTAASNKNGFQSFAGGGDNIEHRIELYQPAYFGASRPPITAAPAAVRHNRKFVVTTTSANAIERAAVLRNGSVTHAFDFDQRYVGLEMQVKSATELELKAPKNSKVAPGGYYLLFLVDHSGVPSVGHYIKIG